MIDTEYDKTLEQCRICLNTTEGKVLMRELKSELEDIGVWNPDPLVMARNAAGRDLYKTLEAMQNSEESTDDG